MARHKKVLRFLAERRRVEALRTKRPVGVSVVDVAVVATGHGTNYASQAVCNDCEEHHGVHEKIMDVKLPGARARKGQKNTPMVE